MPDYVFTVRVQCRDDRIASEVADAITDAVIDKAEEVNDRERLADDDCTVFGAVVWRDKDKLPSFAALTAGSRTHNPR